jgi:hypothetical protein
MKIAFRSLESSDLPALLAFSKEMFGNGHYQSERAYLDWLYEENPNGRGLHDAVLATADGKIAGIVHRMVLPCVGGGEAGILFSLQNHIVRPDLRGGAGMMLLRQATRDGITYSPGVHGRLSEAYRRLGYVELPSFWLTRLLRPARAAIHMALRKFGRDGAPGVRIDLAKVRRAVGPGVLVTASPTPAALCALASRLGAQAEARGGCRIAWTEEGLRWRFFSPRGPRHILVERGGDWAILSLGLRSGVKVSRLLETGGDDPHFMKTILRAAKASGGAVALAHSTLPEFRDRLLASGWRSRKDPPTSFAKGIPMLAASAAAGDVGFEAFGAEVAG